MAQYLVFEHMNSSHHLRLACGWLALVGLLSAALAAERPHVDRDLASWRFNQPDCLGDQNQHPLLATNLQLVPSFESTALSMQSTNGVAQLKYRLLESNGQTNLDLNNGSVRLWILNGWRRERPTTNWMRLLEAGDWKISIAPPGDLLVFQTPGAGGSTITNLLSELAVGSPYGSREADLRWHEVVLRYTPTNSVFIVDGVHKKDILHNLWSGPGTAVPKGIASAMPDISVGSAADGSLPFIGAIDNLQTFAFPIDPSDCDTYRGRTVLLATPVASPPSIRLDWFQDFHPMRNLERSGNIVQRRVLDRSDWSFPRQWETLGWVTNALSGTDTRVTPGVAYEYKVGDRNFQNLRYVRAGIDLPPVEQRGQVLLLIAEPVASALAADLKTLEADLVGDGWQVVRQIVPGHNDSLWSANTNAIFNIKESIRALWAAKPGALKAIFILGHVAVPYSGASSEDGHGEHFGAWPADAYYGDITGIFTDKDNLAPNASEPRRNQPNDGKFDQAGFPQEADGKAGLDVAVGRVDFSRLPGLGRRSEVELLRQYLHKDHAFRFAQTVYPNRVVEAAYFGHPFNGTGECINYNALRAATAFCGLQPNQVAFGDIFQPDHPALVGLQGGFGGAERINTNLAFSRDLGGSTFTTQDFGDPAKEPYVAWYILAGSWFGDWNLPDNLLRASLSTPHYGLLASFGFGVNFRFDAAELGGCVGEVMVATSHGEPAHWSTEPIGYNTIRAFALLGDPTLRLIIAPPPSALRLRRSSGQVSLSWSRSPTVGALYAVYRSTNSLSGPFIRLNDAPIDVAAYIDPSPPSGHLLYEVRAMEKTFSPTGIFTNLSQGIFAESR